MKKLSVIIPAYREEEAIGKTIQEINECFVSQELEYEILVIDDASPDKTSEIAAQHENVRVISHSFNKGVGAARKTGLRNAKNDIIAMIDADYSYSAYDIIKLLDNLKNCDMAVGAREKDYGNFILLRGITKWLLKNLASYISGRKITDLNSGLRVFRKKPALKFISILPNGHSWVSTITLCYLCNDYDIEYIPVQYRPRIGHSTFHPIKDTMGYFNLILRTVFYFYPLKVFFPLGLGIFLWGALRLIYQAKIVGTSVRTTDIMLVLGGIIIWTLGFTADLIVRQMSYQYHKFTEERD